MPHDRCHTSLSLSLSPLPFLSPRILCFFSINILISYSEVYKVYVRLVSDSQMAGERRYNGISFFRARRKIQIAKVAPVFKHDRKERLIIIPLLNGYSCLGYTETEMFSYAKYVSSTRVLSLCHTRPFAADYTDAASVLFI